MKIPSSSSSTLAPESASTLPQRPLSAPPTLGGPVAERRHHGSSADLLRRLGGAGAATPVTAKPQIAALGTLIQSLCDAMQSSRPSDQLPELLHAGWYDAVGPDQAEVTVRHAWPFTAGECAVTSASMRCRASDGALQNLSMNLAGEPVDMSQMQQQFGPMQASPAYLDGGPGDVHFSCEQPWGRLGVVTDAAGTSARALVLELKTGAVAQGG